MNEKDSGESVDGSVNERKEAQKIFKLLHDAHYQEDEIYGRLDRVFWISQGFMLTAAWYLLSHGNKNVRPLIYLLPLVGTILSFIWFRLLHNHALQSVARRQEMRRIVTRAGLFKSWRDIGDVLMCHRNDSAWEKPDAESIKDKAEELKKWEEKNAGWNPVTGKGWGARLWIPKLFVFVWCILLFSSLLFVKFEGLTSMDGPLMDLKNYVFR